MVLPPAAPVAEVVAEAAEEVEVETGVEAEAAVTLAAMAMAAAAAVPLTEQSSPAEAAIILETRKFSLPSRWIDRAVTDS